MRHQIGRQLADGGAIHHQTEMLGPDMLAALLKTLGHGRNEANAVAALGFLDAMAGFERQLVHDHISSSGRQPVNAGLGATFRNYAIGFASVLRYFVGKNRA